MGASKQIDLDIQISSTGDPRYLVVTDFSEWGVIVDKPAILEITVAGATTPVVFEFTKNSVSQFNSANLLLDCDTCPKSDLPDGIYTITLKGSPDTINVTRKFIKTDLINLKLDQYLLENDTEFKESTYAGFRKVRFLIAVAEAHLRQDNDATAQMFLQEAYDTLDTLTSC